LTLQIFISVVYVHFSSYCIWVCLLGQVLGRLCPFLLLLSPVPFSPALRTSLEIPATQTVESVRSLAASVSMEEEICGMIAQHLTVDPKSATFCLRLARTPPKCCRMIEFHRVGFPIYPIATGFHKLIMDIICRETNDDQSLGGCL
jgi:hypothetical protein